MNDGSTDRESQTHSAGLGGVESLENAVPRFDINPGPGIAHRNEHTVCVAFLGANQQLSKSAANRAHCFDRVKDQVQNDLLQLNAIPHHAG
jgi:hypothetical protein